MITFNNTGNFEKTNKFLENAKNGIREKTLRRYGDTMLTSLKSYTPVRTGKTSNSWRYEIIVQPNYSSIEFYNSNTNNNVPIAIILQYGHATRNGGWVRGIDYINPALRYWFIRLADAAWKEVSSI